MCWPAPIPPLAASALFPARRSGPARLDPARVPFDSRSALPRRCPGDLRECGLFPSEAQPVLAGSRRNLLPDRAAAANLATFPVGNKCDAAPTDWAVAPGRAGAPPHSLGLRRYPPAQCVRARRRFRAEAPPLDRGLFRRATDVPARRCGREGVHFWLDAGSDRPDRWHPPGALRRLPSAQHREFRWHQSRYRAAASPIHRRCRARHRRRRVLR